ncbi:hypothetical protein Tco_0761972 [Tanacetum coccineum]
MATCWCGWIGGVVDGDGCEVPTVVAAKVVEVESCVGDGGSVVMGGTGGDEWVCAMLLKRTAATTTPMTDAQNRVSFLISAMFDDEYRMRPMDVSIQLT